MRKSCLDCVAKHLGSAAVYIEEVEMGYPNYYGYAIGELAHAASECLEECPNLAWAIREHRIKWQAGQDSGKPHRIPFEALFGYLSAMKGLDDGVEIQVPDEVYQGLDRDDKGNVTYSMDTRP